MVQPKLINNSKSATLEIPEKEKNQNDLWQAELKNVGAFQEIGFWNSTFKILHLGFTVAFILRLFTLILNENLGPGFVSISQHFNFTSTGLNLKPAVNYLLWLSVVVLNVDALWHVYVSYDMFARTGYQVIKFDRKCARMRLKYCMPQIILLGLLVSHAVLECGPPQPHEISLRHLIIDVLVLQSYCTIVLLTFNRMLKLAEQSSTPYRVYGDLQFQICILLVAFHGLLFVEEQFKFHIQLLGHQIQVVLILHICFYLLVLALSCISALNSTNQTPNGGVDGMPIITVT